MNKEKNIIRLDTRGYEVTNTLDQTVENLAVNNGVRKISTLIPTGEVTQVYGKLRRGYVVEGLLRKHGIYNEDVYILGKEL